MNAYDPYIRMVPSGVRFYLLRPTVDMIHLRDIAWHLSGINRFTGGVRYTVAEHCVRVSRLLPPELEADGLLHDASEAYLNDLSNPLKALFPEYKKLQRAIEAVIAERFNLTWPEPTEVKAADWRMFATENRDLMPVGPDGEADACNMPADIQPLSYTIEPWTTEVAYAIFLARARKLVLYGTNLRVAK